MQFRPDSWKKIYRYCFDVVETYHPYKEEIHELLYDMRQNYEEGKRRVDDKIQSGIWQWISEESNEYRVEVNKHQPASYSSIIDAHIKDTHLESLLPKVHYAFKEPSLKFKPYALLSVVH